MANFPAFEDDNDLQEMGSPSRICVDCGEPTDNEYLCDACMSDDSGSRWSAWDRSAEIVAGEEGDDEC